MLWKINISCLLPEIIDPFHTRTMAIRELKYILDAMRKYKRKKGKSKKYVKKCFSKSNCIHCVTLPLLTFLKTLFVHFKIVCKMQHVFICCPLM